LGIVFVVLSVTYVLRPKKQLSIDCALCEVRAISQWTVVHREYSTA